MNKSTWKSETGCMNNFHIYTKCKEDYNWMTSFLHWKGIKTTPGTKKNKYGKSLRDRYIVSMYCTTSQYYDIQKELKGKIGSRGSSHFVLL